MKKLMIALAIVALASVAQAEVVASWTASGANNFNSMGTVAATTSGYGFSMTDGGGFNGTSAPAGATFAGAGATAGSASAAYDTGEYLYFTWNNAYTLTLDSVTARYSRGSGGATSAQWGTIIGGVWTDIGDEISGIVTATPTTSTTPTTTSFTGVSGLESGQLGVAFYGGTGTSATDWVRFDSRPSATPQVALSLNGTMEPTAIPEPATMGLLGIGALAMVLRRKIRK
ncbi:MAG TPA: PEP-CTERM sorting domain-containing protein [Kiritimatiellia bacterium]|nr:PEP-CTERM sorting domain-containing protein [Kiritimatiellia bacterium]